MKKLVKRTVSLFLCSFLVLSSTGCNTDGQLYENQSSSEQIANIPADDSSDETANHLSEDSNDNSEERLVDLMADFPSQDIAIEPSQVSKDFLQAAADFSVNLLQHLESEQMKGTPSENASSKESQNSPENMMISPLSILTALSMTVNGAAGNTEKAMLDVLCKGMPVNELNQNIYSLKNQLTSSEQAKLLQANSIWFRNDSFMFQPNQEFLQTNAFYYNADIFKAAFDGQTLKDINNWVSEHTEHQIPELLDEIPEDAVMYLINALAFDAEWDSPYEEGQILDGTFTLENGETVTVPMMHSSEYQYLKMEQAEGFIKPYSEGYSFAALLPDQGITLSDFVKNLTGDKLSQTLAQAAEEPVEAVLPEFTADYQTNLAEPLKAMGMSIAFDENQADFSGMKEKNDSYNLYIGRVLHSTFISVSEKGTQAGAATAVEMDRKSAVFSEHQIILDRPFLYLIIDQTTGFPIFIGQLYNPAQ